MRQSLLVVEFLPYFKILYFIIEYCDWWKYDYISIVWFTSKHNLLQVGIHEIQGKTPHTINLERFFSSYSIDIFYWHLHFRLWQILRKYYHVIFSHKRYFTSISGTKRVYKTYIIRLIRKLKLYLIVYFHSISTSHYDMICRGIPHKMRTFVYRGLSWYEFHRYCY